jgi:hypothetical protein
MSDIRMVAKIWPAEAIRSFASEERDQKKIRIEADFIYYLNDFGNKEFKKRWQKYLGIDH